VAGVLASASLAQAAPPPPPLPLLEVATDPGHPAPFHAVDSRPDYSYNRRRPDSPSESLSVGLAGGRVFSRGLSDGFYGRLSTDFLFRAGDEVVAGVDFLALEGWGTREGGGGSLPFSLQIGSKQGPLVFLVGVGWYWVLLDHVRDETGLGFLAPQGSAKLGLDLGFLRVFAEGRAAYRWQIGADDRGQLQVGALVELIKRD
jgi:hypothetical protein